MIRKSIYSRPAKPLSIPITPRARLGKLDLSSAPQPIIVDKATECHATPGDVAARMVDYLGERGDFLTLEPSAGTGQLAKALTASGHSKFELVMIERHHALTTGLYSLGTVMHRCFLEYAEEVRGKVEFPRIIMNPPFSAVRAHLKAALSLMGRHGHDCPPVLVALVPVTFQHDRAETLETLPPDTFSTAKVHTKIIRIYGD